MNAWLSQRNVSVEDVEHVVAERHGLVEVALHLDGETGRVGLPVTVVSDRQSDGGQNVISHGPDRNLSVDEIGGIQLVEDAAVAEA
jgi:hypothetical protein